MSAEFRGTKCYVAWGAKLKGRLSLLSARATLEHGGDVVEVFPTGTFPSQGGSFSLVDEAVTGFTGSSAGTWTLCLIDTDAFGDSGVLQSWSVHN